jgi:hypothetical protein
MGNVDPVMLKLALRWESRQIHADLADELHVQCTWIESQVSI